MTLLEQISADLPIFFDTVNGFAVTATIEGTPIDVIFDEPYEEFSTDGPDIEGTEPRVTGKTSDLASYKRGDLVILPDLREFVVLKNQQDGTGVSFMLLDVAP